MESQLIVDGRVVALDEHTGALALEKLEAASPGNALVALSFDGRVLVRWVDAGEAARIVPAPKPDAKARRNAQPTKKRCPWLYTAVESQFDELAAERDDELVDTHSRWKQHWRDHGKKQESYRRWLGRVKRDWVRAVVSGGEFKRDLHDEGLGLFLVYPSNEADQDDQLRDGDDP